MIDRMCLFQRAMSQVPCLYEHQAICHGLMDAARVNTNVTRGNITLCCAAELIPYQFAEGYLALQ